MVSKTDRKRSDAAIEAFHKYYSSPSHWGSDRWHGSLFEALAATVKHARMNNHYVFGTNSPAGLSVIGLPTIKARNGFDKSGDGIQSQLTTVAGFEDGIEISLNATGGDGFTQPQLIPSIQDQNVKLYSHYNLDAASLLPVILLDPQPGNKVLDMCAAPGGKSIAIGQKLFLSGNSALHSNESHPARHTRLARNLASYFPPALLGSGSVQALELDASSADFSTKAPVPTSLGIRGYDKVLLDAPCSSERHIIQSFLSSQRSGGVSNDMMGFRTGVAGKKAIVKLQTELLMNALRVCRTGGKVVYSTCSIDRQENEGVVKAVVLKANKGKEGFRAQLVDMEDEIDGLGEWSEKCEVGRICLPDHGDKGKGHGWGPIYFCVLFKTVEP
ncbi:hypothetical protein C1H76_5588 [Elsinoe australis]|uniref:NOL1/NOP2/Sun domain family member 4 n=1 Tax=Elsinoe australis TaxID=40998 RepID=A0A4U7AY55_9PEZI|nr:hypothetical protein C1H76_5588 [Elsinoe australis]